MATGLIFDGIAGSQAIDSSKEILDVAGADISDLIDGKANFNFEHLGAGESEKHSPGEELVGKVTYAKKIFTDSDCENSRQRAYRKQIKGIPFIYIVGRLFDQAGHRGAQALAAQMRDAVSNGDRMILGMSVEGSTLRRDGNILKESIIRRVALTSRACNKTAELQVISDPGAPQGFDKNPEPAKDILDGLGKQEHEHPGFTRLGGITETEYTEFTDQDHTGLVKSLAKLKTLRKTLTAGSGDCAPSQLTGGAALQREDIIRSRPRAMKALKRYLDKHEHFDKAALQAALKAELPDASQEFIDHFANIAEDYTVKIRKKDEDSPYPKLNPDIGGGIGGEAPRVDRAAEPKGEVPASRKGALEMKDGGKLLIATKGAWKGARRVSLQQHFPDDNLYHALLKPDEGLEKGHIDGEDHAHIMKTVHEPWHRAMANWLPLNKALSEGKVPKSIIAKSVIFAAMSPNSSVPIQERYYGHYMDMLNNGTVDPFKPISEDAIKEFTQRSVSGVNPVWNRQFYDEHPLGVNAGGDNLDNRDDIGELPQIMGLRNAHKLFPYLEHLTAKHKDDGQGIAAELMDMKAEHNRFKSKTDIDKRSGRSHIERTAPDHERTLGFGPKLTRYLLGMYGGGNMIVPDRHMVRSSFDLHQEHDQDILNKLQTQVVTKAQNEPLLRAMDHNFFTHHPAVKHVLETFPKHFAGREQQAIFPAFWLHWLTIGHYDRMRGRPSMAFNTDTDHRVFWDSVRDEMIKHGLHPHPIHEGRMAPEDDSFDFGENLGKAESSGLDPWPRHPHYLDHPVWLKAAGALQALTQRWGESPALMAFFSHIVPVLAKAETPVPPVQHAPHPAYHPHLFKAEALLIDLRKALTDAGKAEHPALHEVAPDIHHVYELRPGPDLKIRRHPAGRFLTAGNEVNILEDYHGHLKSHLSEGPADGHSAQQIANLRSNHKFDVASMADIMDGKRSELWAAPVHTHPKRPDSSFEVQRHDQEQPDHLLYIDGKPHLNGQAMKDDQLQAILQHVRNGHASIRYRQGKQESIRKMQLVLENLMKADDPAAAAKVHEALGKLDQLVASGQLDPHHAEALRQHAFTDPMTGGVLGNKFAFSDFRNRSDAKGGVHVMMDGNSFKSINDKYGHETGDQAIKAMGTAVKAAADEAAPGAHKIFRPGGDEFFGHFPTHEHAASFARALRNKLEQVPPIQGQHKLSMALGFGVDPHTADQALNEAKKQKYDPSGMVGADSRKWVGKYAPGAEPSMAHSLVPGFEGAVPLDHTQLDVKAPPAPQPQPQPAAPVVHTPPPAQAESKPTP